MSTTLLLQQALQSGQAAYTQGDWPSALTHARSAVTLAPRHAGARNLLGLALLQSEQHAAAIAELETAVGLDRHNPSLLGNLAQAHATAGQHEAAHQIYRRAQRLAPAHWPYAMGAAVALAEQGKAAEAEPMLHALAQRHPHEAWLLYNLGNVQRDLHKLPEAEHSFRAALAIAPADSDAQLGLGTVLHRQSKLPEAEAVYRGCVNTHPDAALPRLNLVSVLIDSGRFAEAVLEAQALIVLAPEIPEAHRFLGAALGHQGKLAQALTAYAAAARLAPEHATTRRTLGGALAEQGHLLGGLRELACAEKLEPGAVFHQQLLSTIFLSAGMFSDGWAAYTRRPYFQLAENRTRPGVVQALPDDLSGKRILVWREQGLGDELFFLRYLPTLKKCGAHITAHVSARLAPMIARTRLANAVVPDDMPSPVMNADAAIFCGDLPHALHGCPASPSRSPASPALMRDHPVRTAAYFPMPAPTLRIPALAESVIRVREQLREAGTPPYLGVTWRAGTAAREQIGTDWVFSKQIPLSALGAALRDWPGTVVALQRRPEQGELPALAAACGRPVADLTALNEHLEDMLALQELIEDYVGVSNTNMHLRAATGRTARVLVPAPAEWRWMQYGTQSPWFPGFRIYRQAMNGDWSAALAMLTRDLAGP